MIAHALPYQHVPSCCRLVRCTAVPSYRLELKMDVCADLGVDDMIMNSIGQAGWNPGLLDSALPGEHPWIFALLMGDGEHPLGISSALVCPLARSLWAGQLLGMSFCTMPASEPQANADLLMDQCISKCIQLKGWTAPLSTAIQ